MILFFEIKKNVAVDTVIQHQESEIYIDLTQIAFSYDIKTYMPRSYECASCIKKNENYK